jgi:hypothetical protein
MADEDKTFETKTSAANRGQMQGLGAGREEMDKQLSPSRRQRATDPQRTEPFDESLDPTTNADRPSQADFAGQEPADRPSEQRSFQPGTSDLDDRNAAGIGDAGDLGAGTPAGVDVHDLGQKDRPQEEWGEELTDEEGLMHSANHTRRAIKTEAERGQGAKTRRMTKDIISRRT